MRAGALVHFDRRHLESGLASGVRKHAAGGADFDQPSGWVDEAPDQLELVDLGRHERVELPGVRKHVVLGRVEAAQVSWHVDERIDTACLAAAVTEELIAQLAVAVARAQGKPRRPVTQRTAKRFGARLVRHPCLSGRVHPRQGNGPLRA